MNRLRILAAGLALAGLTTISGCSGGVPPQKPTTGMPPDVAAEFNRRMGSQGGAATAPQPGGMPGGAPTAPR
jgi:hypothetical protein